MPEAERSKLPVLQQVQFFSPNEAALVLGVSMEQINCWIEAGHLIAFQLGAEGQLVRIRGIDLEAFILAHSDLINAARRLPGEKDGKS